jgi:uncharacterized protein
MSKRAATAKLPPSPFKKTELNKCLRSAAKGDTQYLLALLNRGLDPNLAYRDWDNLRPLCSAARHGQLAVARLLLKTGADPNLQDSWLGMPPNGTPLENAAGEGHLPVMRLLLDQGADINKKGNMDPLSYAVSSHKNEAARFLIEAGASVTAGNLRQAVARGNTEGAKLLIEAGADVNTPNKHGEISLHIGAYSRRPQMTALLIGAGAHLNHTESLRGRTPLHVAVLTQRDENVRLLLAAGADPIIKDKSALTPLHYAEHWGHEACAKLLREAMKDRKVTASPKTRRAIKLLKDQSREYLGHESGLKSK